MYQEVGRVWWYLKICVLSDIFQQTQTQANTGVLNAIYWGRCIDNHWLRKYDIVFLLPRHQFHLTIDKGGADQIRNANIYLHNLQNRLGKD